MTFKQKLLLSIAFTLPYTIFLAALSNTPMPTQTPTTKNKTAEKLPELKIKYDTIVVTAKNFDYVKHKTPGGVYNWQNNTIIISHFETDSQDDEIINYCRINQAHESLVLVHEKEHARKSHLTKKIHHLPDYTRAQIAALNEIVAPAAEIIAVLDYEYKNKQQHPFTYKELKEARDEIIALNKHKNNLSQTPTNFNDTRIANTVIKYAAKRFIRHSSNGTYLGTINTVAKKPNYYLKHTPSDETQKNNRSFFIPTFNIWDALWEFETAGGNANLWRAADTKTKNELLLKIDSVINRSVQQKTSNFVLTQKQPKIKSLFLISHEITGQNLH